MDSLSNFHLCQVPLFKAFVCEEAINLRIKYLAWRKYNSQVDRFIHMVQTIFWCFEPLICGSPTVIAVWQTHGRTDKQTAVNNSTCRTDSQYWWVFKKISAMFRTMMKHKRVSKTVVAEKNNVTRSSEQRRRPGRPSVCPSGRWRLFIL